MRSILRLALSSVGLLHLVATPAAGSSSNQYDFRWLHASSTELRIIMDTSVTESSPLSHSSTVRDVRDWLVVIDLNSPLPIQKAARVYGPLWSVDDRQSWLNHADGVSFTQEDRKAKAKAGFVAFDDAGAVVRIRPGANGSTRDRLKISSAKAEWVADGPFEWNARALPPGSEDEIQTLSHRYRLHRDDATRTQLFETLTGKRVEDPWLESAFETYRTMKEMGNVAALLTNELDYLVCFPAPLWNRSGDKDAPRQFVETFEWNGKTYDRKDWAFFFKRGSPEPVIFRKAPIPGVMLFTGGPSQVLSIDGVAWLLYLTDTGASLVALESGEQRSMNVPWKLPSVAFGTGILHWNIRSLPDRDEIILLATDASSENVAVYFWNYRTGAVRHKPLAIQNLFREPLLGKNSPKHVFPVLDPLP
jgi:hypothetical protein